MAMFNVKITMLSTSDKKSISKC